MFSRLPLAAGTAILLAAPAFAGGFTPAVTPVAPVAPAPVIAPAPVTPVSTGSDWSGFYAGGQLGFGSLSIDDNDDATDDEDFDGALYGLHAGYMYDFGSIVAGAEIDFDGTQIEVGEGDTAVEVGSVLRAKARLGYDAGRFLPYVTAGFAQARLNSDDEATDDLLEDKYDGSFYGIGAAYAVNERFVVGAEVLRHSFEDTPVADFDTDVTTATLRASIRF